MQNLTVQKIVIGLVTLVFFAAAPFLTAEFLDGNTFPFFLIFGVGVLLLFVFWLKDRCWMVIPVCLPIEGRFNFLPLNFSMLELSIMYVLAYMMLQVVMGKPLVIKGGSPFIWIFLAPLLGIVLYHWIRSGDIGIRALGGTGWGGRVYFQILLYSLAIPIIASYSGSSTRDFQWVPLLYFLGTFMDLVPNTMTTIVPGLAPYIFKVYSAVNTGAYGRELMGAFTGFNESVERFRNFSIFGVALALVILSYVPFRTWLRPERLWVVPALALCLFMAAFSGFRSSIFNFGSCSLTALWATARSRVVFLVPLGLGALLAVSLSQGVLLNYPISVQRALTFLPGQWDQQAQKDADSSSDWRREMRELFFAEYFLKAPLIGQGYHYDPIYSLREFDLFMRITVLQTTDTYGQVRPFIERRQPHEGDIHLLLATGVLGLVFFILFSLTVCGLAIWDIYRTPAALVAPIQIWGAAILVQQTASFFVVYGDLGPTLGMMGPVAAILFAYKNLVLSAESKPAPVPNILDRPLPQASGVT
jgi:O-Antigen ligase